MSGLTDVVTKQAERARLPDSLIRAGVRRLVAARLRQERSADPEARDSYWEAAWSGPIAVETGLANEQHYEVPGEFFEAVLGPALKYSCCLWESPGVDLATAELAMIDSYASRARLEDGQRILELGCGWGSFSLWAAARFPTSRIVAMSNSKNQRLWIEEAAFRLGLSNLDVVTADINDFEPGETFDRIISIEMLEHVRNHRLVFERMRAWLDRTGVVFTHVFAHRRHAYPYEMGSSGDWMARNFFTGGVMPSRDLLPRAAHPLFEVEAEWWIDGTHYARTLEAWLARLDNARERVAEVLDSVYPSDVDVWIQRWRMFFMACAELFSYREGKEWGVAHHLFRPG